jgi:hypothetical protein
MIDPNLAILTWLKTSTDLAALVGTNIFSPMLPEGFSAMAAEAPDAATRAVVVRRRGGKSQPEIPAVLDPSFAIECWAMEAPDAQQIYGVIRDLMHGATGVDLGAAGFVILSQEEVPGQDITDPETHWAVCFAYYHVELRGPDTVVPPYVPQLYQGQGAPVTLHNNEDLYYDLGTGNLYEQVTGAWVYTGNIAVGGEMPSSIYHLVAAAGTNAANIKAAAGVVTGWKVYNDTEYPVYVKLFDKATTPDPGSDTPKQTIGLDAGIGEVNPPSGGITYTNGIGIAITKGMADTDATPVVAGDCVVDIFYQ